VDQGEPLAAAQPAALTARQRGNDFLAVDPFFELVDAFVPDAHTARTVLALGDVAFKIGVVHGVVFGLYRQMVLIP
jgi:hypothetical protein